MRFWVCPKMRLTNKLKTLTANLHGNIRMIPCKAPLSDVAQQKMAELDAAYDAIVAARRGQTSYGGANRSAYQNTQYNTYSYSGSQFSDIRAQIRAGRVDDAEMLLDGIPREQRSAEWYFLKGQIQQRRGWFDEAYNNYSRACQMDRKTVSMRRRSTISTTMRAAAIDRRAAADAVRAISVRRFCARIAAVNVWAAI